MRLDDYFVDLRRLSGERTSIHQLRLGCIVGAEFAAALDQLDREVQEFVLGIVSGFMPTEDGLFTYQGPGATPIHYRHVQTAATAADSAGAPADRRKLRVRSLEFSAAITLCRELAVQVTPNNGVKQLDHGIVLAGRQGGRWEWSTDRLTWSSVATTDIPEESMFGGRRWALVSQNQQLVRFLNEYPVIPLFRKQILLAGGSIGEGRFPRSVDDAFWVSSHGGVFSHNSLQLKTFKRRILTHAPTMPCVTARSLTIHQLLQPPIVIQLDQRADKVIPLLPIELRRPMQAAHPYRVVRRVGAPGDDCVSFSEIWRTWDVIRLAERGVRMSLQGRSSQVPGSVDAVDLSLPEDADRGFIVCIAPA